MSTVKVLSTVVRCIVPERKGAVVNCRVLLTFGVVVIVYEGGVVNCEQL